MEKQVNSIFKRFLAALLCIAMLVPTALLPVSAMDVTEPAATVSTETAQTEASVPSESEPEWILPECDCGSTNSEIGDHSDACAQQAFLEESNEEATESPVAFVADNGTVTTVIAASDFQLDDNNHELGGNQVLNILNKIKETHSTAQGFLFCGDYDRGWDDSATGKSVLSNKVLDVYENAGLATNAMIWVQGNHDPTELVTNGTLSSSGAHDADKYGVYVINEKDYMWYNNNEATVKTTAENLKTYLDAKVEAKYTKPIFVVSHLPLHYNMRTKIDGDGQYANYIFDVLNDAGAQGLNIIFMFGHNHSNGWDDYLGGAAIYLAKGDSINIAQASKDRFAVEKLNFTYMNAGYVGYYNGHNDGTETDLTMSVFQITEDTVTVYRYTGSGVHDLKSKGVTNAYKNEAGYSPDTNVYTAPQTIKLNKSFGMATKSDNGVTVSGLGVTGVTVTKQAAAVPVGYSAYQTFDINVVGFAEGNNATVAITLDNSFDASRPVFIIDHEKGTSQVCKIVDGKVTFNTNHFSLYSAAQTDNTGLTANGKLVTYTERVTSLEEGVPYVITSYDYDWVMSNETSSWNAHTGLALKAEDLATTAHRWYLKDGYLVYGSATSTNYMGLEWDGTHFPNNYFTTVGVRNNYPDYQRMIVVRDDNGVTFGIRRNSVINGYSNGAYNSETYYLYMNRLGGGGNDKTAAGWYIGGSGAGATNDSSWYFNRVYENAPVTMTINGAKETIYIGNNLNLTTAVTNNGQVTSAYTITWSSSDTSVATVSSKGVVTPKANGHTYITATLTAVDGHALQSPISIRLSINAATRTAATTGTTSTTVTSNPRFACLFTGSSITTAKEYLVVNYRNGWVLTGTSRSVDQTIHTTEDDGLALKRLEEVGFDELWFVDDNKYMSWNSFDSNYLNYDGIDVKQSAGSAATDGTKFASITRNNDGETYTIAVTHDGTTSYLNQLGGFGWKTAHVWSQHGNNDDGSKWCFYELVSDKTVALTVSPSSAKIYAGKQQFLVNSLTVNGVATSNYELEWFSSNPAIATVKNGIVTGVKNGNVTITAALTWVEGEYTEGLIVEIPIQVVGVSTITLNGTEADIAQRSGSNAPTNVSMTINYADGTTKTIPITLDMLTDVNGNRVSAYSPETYTDLKVTYAGEIVCENFQLTVVERPQTDYPAYPEEGAVMVDKGGTGIDFQASGLAQIELSATGIPSKKGADVVIMLDTSSSMTEYLGGNATRLQVLTGALNNLLTKLQRNGPDGEPQDIRVAIADFNGYYLADDKDSPYYLDPNDTILDDAIRNTPHMDDVYTGNNQLDAGAFVDVNSLGENPFTTAQYAGETSARYTLTYSNGTNYDYAFDATYQLLEAIRKKNEDDDVDRDLFVIFMSDGCPYQYNYYSCWPQNAHSEYWNNWLTGTFDVDTMTAPNANKNYYNPDGLHWMAEAIKGNPNEDYMVIRKNDSRDTDGDDMISVKGLDATIYSIGMCLQDDGPKIKKETMDKVIRNIASSDKYYYSAQTAEELEDAFNLVTDHILYAATNAYFLDTMGKDYDLQMGKLTYTDFDGTTKKTITPVIEVRNYTSYTRHDAMVGNCDMSQVGTRVKNSSGNEIYQLIEKVTFNTAGTAAFSNVLGSSTNILKDGVICANTFWYNTTSSTVKIDANGDGTAEYDLPAETFYWKLGTIASTEMTLSYYVYLTNCGVKSSNETGVPAGVYDTNESATLHYINYLGNTCFQNVPTPRLPWRQATVGYGFYLVDREGNPIINQTTGEIGSFENSIKVTQPVYRESLLNTGAEEIVAELVSADGKLPEGYVLFDEGAEYQVTLNSNGSGSYTITVTTDDGKYTTYVVGIEKNAVTGNGTTETTNYTTANTVVWFGVVADVKCVPDTVVIDYGRPVNINVLANDMMIGEYGKVTYIDRASKITDLDAYKDALKADKNLKLWEYLQSLPADSSSKVTVTSRGGSYGKLTITDKTKGLLQYTPTNMLINKEDTFVYAVNYTGPLGTHSYYYSTVTVIPEPPSTTRIILQETVTLIPRLSTRSMTLQPMRMLRVPRMQSTRIISGERLARHKHLFKVRTVPASTACLNWMPTTSMAMTPLILPLALILPVRVPK